MCRAAEAVSPARIKEGHSMSDKSSVYKATGSNTIGDATTGNNEPSARYQRGLAKMAEMFGEFGAKTVDSLENSAPDLGRYLAEYVFGDVLSRPGLDLKSREIATVAALTALGTAGPQLRAHIRGALNVGCSQQEIIEIVMQMAVYAGFPAALNGIQAAKEVFAERAAKK